MKHSLPPYEKKEKGVYIRLKPSLWEKVEELARTNGYPKSTIVELALMEFIKKH